MKNLPIKLSIAATALVVIGSILSVGGNPMGNFFLGIGLIVALLFLPKIK